MNIRLMTDRQVSKEVRQRWARDTLKRMIVKYPQSRLVKDGTAVETEVAPGIGGIATMGGFYKQKPSERRQTLQQMRARGFGD